MNATVKSVGQRVVVRDAFGKMHPAVICPVPASWRDQSKSTVTTCRGQFLKAWVRIGSVTSEPIPWPLEDIFDPAALPKSESGRLV